MADLLDVLGNIEIQLGMDLFDYQVEAAEVWQGQDTAQPRLCLFYRTGAGKSITALVLMRLRGVQKVLVIAPPSTRKSWIAAGELLGIEVEVVSHMAFRQKGYLVPRDRAVVADEFHLFGGHTGIGWKKLDRLSKGLQAPLILASATPNYNDAERVYCIQHILAPSTVSGGFIQFLYQHCVTEQNPFGQIPNVTGFQKFKDSAEYLAALPEVVYLPDDVIIPITDIPLLTRLPPWFDELGLDIQRRRVMASQMEARHRRAFYLRVGVSGELHSELMFELVDLIVASETPVLVFCASSRIAEAVFKTLSCSVGSLALLTGKTTAKAKDAILDAFRARSVRVLVGTATLATGTDGLDKVCDTLIIVHDTDDNSLRQQLVGRIRPRGIDADATKKQVFRLLPDA